MANNAEELEWDVCDLCKKFARVKKLYGMKICTFCDGPPDLSSVNYHRGWK